MRTSQGYATRSCGDEDVVAPSRRHTAGCDRPRRNGTRTHHSHAIRYIRTLWTQEVFLLQIRWAEICVSQYLRRWERTTPHYSVLLDANQHSTRHRDGMKRLPADLDLAISISKTARRSRQLAKSPLSFWPPSGECTRVVHMCAQLTYWQSVPNIVCIYICL